MPDYSNNRFARKPFKSGGNSRFGGPTQKFKAECSKCGNSCEVPFRPNGKKPVFCSNCFVKDEGDAPRGRSNFGGRPSFERPSYDRPQAAPRDDRGLQEVKKELQGVNDKLERLIRVMEVRQSVSEAVTPKKAAKKAVKKK